MTWYLDFLLFHGRLCCCSFVFPCKTALTSVCDASFSPQVNDQFAALIFNRILLGLLTSQPLYPFHHLFINFPNQQEWADCRLTRHKVFIFPSDVPEKACSRPCDPASGLSHSEAATSTVPPLLTAHSTSCFFFFFFVLAVVLLKEALYPNDFPPLHSG